MRRRRSIREHDPADDGVDRDGGVPSCALGRDGEDLVGVLLDREVRHVDGEAVLLGAVRLAVDREGHGRRRGTFRQRHGRGGVGDVRVVREGDAVRPDLEGAGDVQVGRVRVRQREPEVLGLLADQGGDEVAKV